MWSFTSVVLVMISLHSNGNPKTSINIIIADPWNQSITVETKFWNVHAIYPKQQKVIMMLIIWFAVFKPVIKVQSKMVLLQSPQMIKDTMLNSCMGLWLTVNPNIYTSFLNLQSCLTLHYYIISFQIKSRSLATSFRDAEESQRIQLFNQNENTNSFPE